jgi:AcrR family transcriptional regulator
MKLRARKDEDKLERRRAILAAGLVLWNETGYGDFTMNAVAERAGVVKGTLYLYFSTKEQLLLTLFMQLLGEFFDDVDTRLEESGRWSKARVVDVMVEALDSRRELARMLTIAGTILEHNINYAAAAACKTVMVEHFARTGSLFDRRLPFLEEGEGAVLLRRFSAIVTGLAQQAFPAAVLQNVYAQPEMSMLRVVLSDELRELLLAILDGLEAQREARPAARTTRPKRRAHKR